MENGGNFEHLGFEGDDDEDLDDDVFSSGSYSFNGRLVISGEPIIFPVLERSVSGHGIMFVPEDKSNSDCEDETDDCISRGQGLAVQTEPLNITFEIFSTRIHESDRKQCVFYSLMVLRAEGGIDTDKAVVERRYSDYAKLFKALKKDLPKLLANVSFPGKVLGKKQNVKPEVIESRSHAFEGFLQEIYCHGEVRAHPAFREFFYLPELREATEKLTGGELKSSLKLLLNSLHLQVKLCDQLKEIIATLGAIVVIHEAQKKFEEANRYVTAALDLIQGDYFPPYEIPLLDTAVKLRWKLQIDRNAEENRLRQVQKDTGIEVDNAFTLRELSVSRFDNKGQTVFH